jgi:precorrin isomerase
MPMLNGKNTTQDEVAHMRTLFQQHPAIARDVKNIENGIVTTTLSDDPKVADALTNHVAEMITRVEQGDNPEVPIQSPTLSIRFEQGASIETEIEIVENGVIVTQTSDNGDVVAALQKHVSEVSDLAARGMVAVHEQMMTAHHGG